MIFGTPVSWFADEAMSLVVFLLCLVHATRRPDATLRVCGLVGFLFFAGVFENIGVWTGTYDYDQHRLMMTGVVPLGVLMMEGVIFYAAWLLVDWRRCPGGAARWRWASSASSRT